MGDATPNKTQPTSADVMEFLQSVEHDRRREDALDLLQLMREATGVEPVMWGPAIVGFGSYRYRYDSGREGEFLKVGFAPRKANLVVYLLDGYEERGEQLERLGPHTIGKSCLYLTRLDRVDTEVLREMVHDSFTRRHPSEIPTD